MHITNFRIWNIYEDTHAIIILRIVSVSDASENYSIDIDKDITASQMISISNIDEKNWRTVINTSKHEIYRIKIDVNGEDLNYTTQDVISNILKYIFKIKQVLNNV